MEVAVSVLADILIQEPAHPSALNAVTNVQPVRLLLGTVELVLVQAPVVQHLTVYAMPNSTMMESLPIVWLAIIPVRLVQLVPHARPAIPLNFGS